MARNLKICLAASSGGHLTQLLKIAECWRDYETFCVTTSKLVAQRLSEYGKVYVIGECNHLQPYRVTRVLFCCLRIVSRERPDVVISTGAAGGCMMCFLGKLFAAKVIWIDSIANTKKLSMSGWMIRPFADLILSQWPDVAEKYPNVEYVGEVI